MHNWRGSGKAPPRGRCCRVFRCVSGYSPLREGAETGPRCGIGRIPFEERRGEKGLFGKNCLLVARCQERSPPILPFIPPSSLFFLPPLLSLKKRERFFFSKAADVFFFVNSVSVARRESCWWLGIRLRQESGEAPKVWRKRSLANVGIIER